MSRFIIFIIASLILVATVSAEEHGLWVVRRTITNQDDLALLRKLQQRFGITDVYLQVRALGSENLTPGAEKQTSPLSFREIVNFCHLNDMSVHAWINAFYVWSKEELPAANHPLLYDQTHVIQGQDGHLPTLKALREAGVEGFYLDPDAVHNIEQIKSVIRYLLNEQQVDGIHFDYFRYPPSPYHFSAHLRAEFLRNNYVDPVQMWRKQSLFASYWGVSRLIYLQSAYEKFIRQRLSARLSALTAFTKALNENCEVSVAVKPDANIAKNDYGQDWLQWLRTEACDYVILMNYSAENKEFKKNLKMAKSYKVAKRIVNGIGVYKLNGEQLQQRISQSQKNGLGGYCLFSFTSFKKPSKMLLGQMF